MIYLSEKTGKKYATEAEALEAEKKYDEEQARLKAEREKRNSDRAVKAKELEKALNEANAAYSKYRELLKNFNKEYGAFHMSVKDADALDIFDLLMHW